MVDEEVRIIGWKHISHCGYCGSCNGGRHKKIFGKIFDDVCGCTFRIDNPKYEDIAFLKKMIEIRIEEILKK